MKRFHIKQRSIPIGAAVLFGILPIVAALPAHAEEVYVSAWFEGKIYKVDTETQAVSVFASGLGILTIEDTPHGKADGAPYAKAAKLLDLAPEQILMVGDHPGRDVAMARSAGLRAALAAYGLQPVFAETGGGILADLQLRYPDDLLRSLP